MRSLSLITVFLLFVEAEAMKQDAEYDRGTLQGIAVETDPLALKYQRCGRVSDKLYATLLDRLPRADADVKEVRRLYALDAAQRHGDWNE